MAQSGHFGPDLPLGPILKLNRKVRVSECQLGHDVMQKKQTLKRDHSQIFSGILEHQSFNVSKPYMVAISKL